MYDFTNLLNFKGMKQQEHSFIKRNKTRCPNGYTGNSVLLTCFRRAKPRMLKRLRV